MTKITPLMSQYRRIKEQHKDKILFFRMGDFFEMFDEDAEIAAPILNIALTYRNKKSGLKTKMCGVPHHSIAQPIAKLLAEGLHIAICDQIEPTDSAQGLVKRAVTRVLSPGMVYDLETLDQLKANYMGAFDKNHISFLDTSTGSAFYYSIFDSSDFFKLIEQFQPSEWVVTSAQKMKCSRLSAFQSMTFSVFDKDLSKEKQPLHVMGKYDSYPESAQRLLLYVFCMQGEDNLKLFRSFEKQSLNKEMYYSRQLYSHLEVFKNYESSSKDTLFSSINRTKTSCGARLLKRWLQSPLIDQNKIERRFDKIDFWISKSEFLDPVRKILIQMGDGERKLGKIVLPTCNARDLLALALWLDNGLSIEEFIESKFFSKELKTALILRDKIKHIISPSCSSLLKEGGIINGGVNPQLDEWMKLTKSSQTHLLEMERQEQKKLSIPSLKIRYNNVFGYYIEIRKTHNSKVPSYYRRKQTLVNAERYTTEELNTLEEKILAARSKMIEMEYQIFCDLKTEILEKMAELMKLCHHWSKLDVYSSLAFLAIENKYVRPHFAKHFKLQGSRHPVLEQKTFHEFVPNTIDLPANQTLILTGPNMAGKSTLMRQAALTVLLAQSGCFVPADQAEIPLFHKMFTRIGASDLLSQGLSTFMVEMKETAEILEKADEKSFIILDEIGRGTATFDGMSLAQAILEFLTVKKKPLLLSATHYEELTKLADHYPSVRNACMAIREEEEKIHFVYLLKEGSTNKSYGIQVARLAGLPKSVVERANQLLFQHESSKVDHGTNLVKTSNVNSKNVLKKATTEKTGDNKNKDSLQKEENLKEKDKQTMETLIDEIAGYALMTQTPIDAMNQIQKWQKIIKRQKQKKSGKPIKTRTQSLSDQEAFLDILN